MDEITAAERTDVELSENERIQCMSALLSYTEASEWPKGSPNTPSRGVEEGERTERTNFSSALHHVYSNII